MTLNQIPNFFLAQFHALVQTLSYNDPTMKPIVSLAILGVVGIVTRLFLKKYPLMIYQFIRGKLIFSVSIIDDRDEGAVNYERFMGFYEANRSKRGTRKFRLIIDRMRSILSADEGTHWFFYDNRYYWFVVKALDSSGSEKIKSKVTIYSYGLTLTPLSKLIDEFAVKPYEKLGIYGQARSREGWARKSSMEKLTLSDMILSDVLLKEITDTLDWFMNNEQWYRDRFLDYKLVIMLEGPPGTGKSYLIRGMAHYLNRSIFLMSTDCADEVFVDRASTIPLSGMGVIEDFDDSKNMLSRDSTVEVTDQSKDVRAKGGIRLSTLLNVLQGVNSSNGQVIMLSTNHIEVLDPAIYRPGRVDKVFHIGLMDNPLVHRYMERMYSPEAAMKYRNFIFAPVKASQLGQLFVTNPHDIDGFVCGLDLHYPS